MECFIDLIESFHCPNTIDSPTRITADTENLIDLCITNYDIADLFSGFLTLHMSDHLPIFVFIPRPQRNNCAHYVPIFRRNFNCEALDAFRFMIENIDLTDIYNETDPNLSSNFCRTSNIHMTLHFHYIQLSVTANLENH